MRILLPGVLVVLLLPCAVPLGGQGSDPASEAARLMEAGRFAEARRILEPRARAEPGDSRAAYLLGRALAEEGHFDDAVEWLERSAGLDARSADTHYVLGVVYGMKARRANVVSRARLAGKARRALETAVALDAEHLDARSALLQYHMIAPGVLGGDRRVARLQAAEIARRSPYRGVLAAGAIHDLGKDPAAAAAVYEAALAEYPDSAGLYLALGAAYGRQGKPEAALALYEGFLGRRPDETRVLYQAARLGAETGQRLEWSAALLKRFLARPPGRGQPPRAAAHWRLGTVYEKQGQPDRAREEYRAALAADPEHRESRDALRRLGG